MSEKNSSKDSSRRKFCKKFGLAGLGASFGIPTTSGRVEGVKIQSNSGATIQTTSQQSADSAQFPVTAGTKARHKKSVVVEGRMNHYYDFDSTFTTTDGSGNQTTMIGTHRFQWDASNARSNVDCATDKDSPYLGGYPAPGSGTSEPQEIFQDIIEATVGAVSTTAGVAIAANEIIQDIVNHYSDFTPDGSDFKQWKWSYSNFNHQSVANHQLNPIFQHQDGSTPTFKVRTLAEDYGNELTFYTGGDAPYVQAGETSTESTSFDDGTVNSTQQKVAMTPGLEPEDFHALPPTTDMTKREREKYGVRDPTQAERDMFDGEVTSVIERYPFVITSGDIYRP